MRRSLSILFTLFLALGPLVALFGEDYEASLPACCRRHGAHHCAMSSDALDRGVGPSAASHFFAAPSQCPLYPHATLAPASSTHAIATSKITALSLSSQSYVLSEQRLGLSSRPFSNLPVRGPPAPASC